MEYSKNMSAVFSRISAIFEAGTLRGDKSPTSNGPGERGDLLSPKGLIDPGKPGYQE
jgi:hypothetical protein